MSYYEHWYIDGVRFSKTGLEVAELLMYVVPDDDDRDAILSQADAIADTDRVGGGKVPRGCLWATHLWRAWLVWMKDNNVQPELMTMRAEFADRLDRGLRSKPN